MEYDLNQRLTGTKQAYWVLRIFTPGKAYPKVHTGKAYGYIAGILRQRYRGAVRRA